MKINTKLLALLALPLFFTSCLKDDCYYLEERVTVHETLVAKDDFRVDIKSLPGEALQEAGKIYVFGNALLINDINRGIHIVDNTQPDNPQFINFIKIPGNVDMAIEGNLLYADSYIDLLTIDLTNYFDPVLLKREKDVFTRQITVRGDSIVAQREYITEKVKVACGEGSSWDGFAGPVSESSFPSNFGGNNQGGQIQGIAGSMARFGLSSGHLYAIDHTRFQVYDLTQGGIPDHLQNIPGRGHLETIFPFGEYLFIGANNGMYIYDNTDPSNPQFLSEFRHALACDPVFATENRAYVTLRDGNMCQNFNNQLDVLDISDITNPTLIKTYPMTNPHGLSVVDHTLFLCDGRDGLKIFDVSDDLRIDENRLAHIRHEHTYDVIALGRDHLIVTGKNGIRQYDSSDPENPKSISFLPTN